MPKLIQFDGTNLYCGGIPADVLNETISRSDRDTIRNKPVIIYGTGVTGLWIIQEFKYAGIPVAAVCDSYKKEYHLNGTAWPIEPLPEALAKYPDAFVVISSVPFYEEISKIVQDYVPEDRIIDIREPIGKLPTLSGYTYRNYVVEHLDTFNWLAEILEDDLSREALQGVLLGRIGRDSSHFSRIFSPCPYFTSEIVQLREDETFVDGGAYFGDTIEDFLQKTKGKFRKIFSFEPDQEYCNQIRNTYANLITQDRLALFQNGLWSRREPLRFMKNGSGSYLTTEPLKDCFDKDDFAVETVALDDCITEPVSFIKMDIEGSELQALHGAQHLIRKNRPILVICVYHKIEDLIEIPRYIHSLQPGYRYYLRHHGNLVYDTVFYAIPEERVKQ